MDSPLFGREAELATLAELAGQATAGAGALVLLRGEAGVGKTALGRTAVVASDLELIEVAATETPASAYAPLVALLRAGMRRGADPLPSNRGLRAALAALLPELAAGLDPEIRDQQLVFEAVAAAMCRMAQPHSLGILLDDLQWADVATLDFLEFLAGVITGEPVLVVATYRSDAVPRGHAVRRLRSTLRRKGRLIEIAVGPLDFAASERLLAARLGGPPAPSLAAAVHDRTEGIPFFIEEMALALKETRCLRSGPAGFEVDPATALPLPESVRDAVLQRVDCLPDDLRTRSPWRLWPGRTSMSGWSLRWQVTTTPWAGLPYRA